MRGKFGALNDASFEELNSPDPYVEMDGFHEAGANGIPRATTVIDADIEQCAAWDYHFMARDFIKIFYEGGGFENSMIEHNGHSSTGRLVIDLKIPGISRREFVTQIVWKKMNKSVLLVVIDSYAPIEYPERSKYVRASATTLAKYEQLEPKGGIPQTLLTWTQQPDMKGFIPKKFIDGAAVGQLMYASR